MLYFSQILKYLPLFKYILIYHHNIIFTLCTQPKTFLSSLKNICIQNYKWRNIIYTLFCNKPFYFIFSSRYCCDTAAYRTCYEQLVFFNFLNVNGNVHLGFRFIVPLVKFILLSFLYLTSWNDTKIKNSILFSSGHQWINL